MSRRLRRRGTIKKYTAPAGGLLKYNPATVVPLSSPSTINIPAAGGDLGSLGSTDYNFVFPNQAVTGEIYWEGGRNIRMIGGYQSLTVSNSTQKYGIVGRLVQGDVYMEGLYLDASTGMNYDNVVIDGIAYAGFNRSNWTRPKVYMQNCRIKGSEWDGGGVHPDIVQRQGPMNGFYAYKVTFETEYQGFFLPWLEQSNGGGENYIDGMPIELENVSGYTREERDGYLLWLGWIGGQNAGFPGTEDPQPITVTNVYVSGLAGDSLGSNLVFPKVGSVSNTGQTIGMNLAGDGLSATWPALAQITGTVYKGTPPGGHYVPAGSTTTTPTGPTPGLGYVSPGYQ